MKKINLLIWSLLMLTLHAFSQSDTHVKPGSSEDVKTYPAAKPNSYWKGVLTSESYEIMVNKGTEAPYHNPYWNNHQKGIYVSAATGKPLFSSDSNLIQEPAGPVSLSPSTQRPLR